jgi:hypothetical protein
MGMQLIETVEVGAGFPAFFEFVSIPQDGVDLYLVISGQVGDSGGPYGVTLQFNNLGYSASKRLYGNGTVVTSSTGANLIWPGNAWGWSNDCIYISNYTLSEAHSYSIENVAENNATESYMSINAGLTASTSPVTSIKVQSNYTSEYTTASLYKITAD